jgi:VanZ family protein
VLSADKEIKDNSGKIFAAVVLAGVVGFGVSLAIEVLQAYLPSRDSNIRDLVTNTAGTLIGALAAFWLVSRRKSQLC